jgi:hypothetical protein
MEIFHRLPHWSEVNPDQNDTYFRKSIQIFVSNSLKEISILNGSREKTIVFSTTEWENYSNGKQFAEEIVNEIKVQLETHRYSNFYWRILLVFTDKQTALYKRFLKTIRSMKTFNNDYEQFVYSISST